MRKVAIVLVVALAVAVTGGHSFSPEKDWSMNATAIEACSCPAFCQCYFNTKPASHHEHGSEAHYCKFNNAYKINKGHYNDVSLDNAKFWISGDLGSEFDDGMMNWAVVTFDKSLNKKQREAIQAIIPHLFPVQWKSLEVKEANFDKWEIAGDRAVATLDGGKTAEVRLTKFKGVGGKPAMVQNVAYWGAPRNDGFIVAPNEVNAYRQGANAFETRGTNGFLITIDINSSDVKKPASGAK